MMPAASLRLRLVHASDAGNRSARKVLEQIAFEARLAGVDAEVVDGPFPVGAGFVYVVVSDDYFAYCPPAWWPSAGLLGRTIGITLERPGTGQFEDAVSRARTCAVSMAVNVESTAELRRRGVNVVHFPWGYCEYSDRWKGRPDERSVDIAYRGSSDPRRDAAIAGCARWWLSHRISLNVPADEFRMLDRASGAGAEGDAALLGRSRITVILHREDSRSLEWIEVVEAMTHGAVVVAEHSVDFGPLVPGEHFVAAHADSIGLLTHLLLDDDSSLQRIRAAAYEFIRDRLPLADSVQRLLATAERLLQEPIEPDQPGPPSKAEAAVRPPWETVDKGPMALLGAELSRLRHRTRELELQQLRAQGRAGPRDDGVIPRLQTPGYAFAEPRISVLVPLFNKAPFVTAALDSILACGRDDVELLVLDDYSDDRSGDLVAKWLREHPELPAALLTCSFNGGAARARNALLRRARGEFAFTLDADNGVYPTAFDAFVRALTDQPDAGVAYGPIEIRRDGAVAGLLSARPLDAEELRWGNYVDSMAMFRTCVLRELGGWNDAMHTWEDYELWLRFLESGNTGTFVPQVHSWYGLRAGTLRTAAPLELARLWSQLRAAAPTILADRP